MSTTKCFCNISTSTLFYLSVSVFSVSGKSSNFGTDFKSDDTKTNSLKPIIFCVRVHIAHGLNSSSDQDITRHLVAEWRYLRLSRQYGLFM